MNQLTLPTARATDPITSHRAAASIGKGVERAVLAMHQMWAERWHDGLTDDELARLLDYLYPPTLKSARSRLTRGPTPRLRDSGRTRPSNRGRQAIVWEVA